MSVLLKESINVCSNFLLNMKFADIIPIFKNDESIILHNLPPCWIQINTTFNSWSEILQGIPQGSIFGPLLSNIDLNGFFL